MTIFYIILLILLIGSLVPLNRQFGYLLISFSILLFIAGYRDISVGTDTANYEDFFNHILSGDDWIRASVEPGWVLLNDLVIYFGGSFNELLLLSTLLVLLPIFYLSYKYSNNAMLSIFFYYSHFYYMSSMNITRQMLSISVSLVALVLLTRDKKIWFIIITLIAATFHYTALILLPLFFIKHFTHKNTILIVFSVLSIFMGIFGVSILIKIISITPYGVYLESYELKNILGNLVYAILLNVSATLILLTTKDRSVKFKLFWCSIIITTALIRIPFADRLTLALSVYMIIFYPYYIYNARTINRDYRIGAAVILVIIAIISFSYSLHSGFGEITPYKNILL